jgi:DNA-binding MarR family transcriptional regulator
MAARTENLVGALALALSDRLDDVLARSSELRVPDAAVLNAIGQFPGRTIEAVRAALGITHGGVVRIVDRLAAAGLVERRPGPDARSLALHLTPTGTELWQVQTRARSEWLAELVRRVPSDVHPQVEPVVSALLAALTPDDDVAEITCRLCDESVCPQRRCPVTLAAEASR